MSVPPVACLADSFVPSVALPARLTVGVCVEGERVATYRVLQAIEYGDRRAEVGDLVDDVPQRSVKWLVDQQYIEVVEAPKAGKRTKATEDVAEEVAEDGE